MIARGWSNQRFTYTRRGTLGQCSSLAWQFEVGYTKAVLPPFRVVKCDVMIVLRLLGQAFTALRLLISEFYYQWAMIYARWGHPTRAFWYFNRAVTMNRGGFKAYYSRGLLFMAVGMPERALGDFSMAIRNNPTHVDARVTRSVVYTLTGRHEEALDDLEQAVEMGADRDDLEYQLHVARTRMGT